MTCRNTGGTQSGGGLHKTGQLGGGMLRHSPNHEALRQHGCPMVVMMILPCKLLVAAATSNEEITENETTVHSGLESSDLWCRRHDENQ